HLPPHRPRPLARARLQGGGHDDDAVRHGHAQRPGPVPPGDRRHRPRAVAGHDPGGPAPAHAGRAGPRPRLDARARRRHPRGARLGRARRPGPGRPRPGGRYARHGRGQRVAPPPRRPHGTTSEPHVTDTTRSIVIASPEGESGKSTVALGVLDLLVRKGRRVGVFRPVSRATAGHEAERDHVLELLLEHDGVDIAYDDAVGVTYKDVHDDPEDALARIVSRFHDLATRCDAVVVLGTDYTDVAGPTELSFNARIAANLGAPVLLVVSGRERTPEGVRTLADVSLSELAAHHAQAVGLVVNRAEPADAATIRDVLTQARPELPVWTIPEEPF